MLVDGLVSIVTTDLNPVGGAHKDALPRGFQFPAIVVHRYNGALEYEFAGPADTKETNVQFDVYGKTSDERDTLMESLTGLMDSFVGTLPDGTVVQGCFRERGPQELPYLPSAEQKGPGFRSAVGYRIVHPS